MRSSSPPRRDEEDTQEDYISVDIETAGPIPAVYSMLSLGACVVGSTTDTFYMELQPINERFVPDALKVSRLNLDQLKQQGLSPLDAMSGFRDWISTVTPIRQPIFVGFNASFDWAFVNWYFHSYLGSNPFGFAALDIKAFYMGISGCLWSETTSRQLPPEFQPAHRQTHNALDDAVAQAEIFDKLLIASASQAHSPRRLSENT